MGLGLPTPCLPSPWGLERSFTRLWLLGVVAPYDGSYLGPIGVLGWGGGPQGFQGGVPQGRGVTVSARSSSKQFRRGWVSPQWAFQVGTCACVRAFGSGCDYPYFRCLQDRSALGGVYGVTASIPQTYVWPWYPCTPNNNCGSALGVFSSVPLLGLRGPCFPSSRVGNLQPLRNL